MNCIIIEDDKLSSILIEEYINKTEDLDLIYSFSSPIDALNKLKSTSIDIDLIFLDIQMPEMSGFELLNVLRSYPQVIIITAQEKYALTSYDYDITDYLLKPISFERFLKSVERAFLKYDTADKLRTKSDKVDNSSFYIRTNQSVIRLKYDNVFFIEALENYIIICTFDTKYTVLHTMKSIEEKLSLKNFKRVHRSYIINMNKIQKIQNNKIIMYTNEGVQRIPISKTYKKELNESLPLIKHLN